MAAPTSDPTSSPPRRTVLAAGAVWRRRARRGLPPGIVLPAERQSLLYQIAPQAQAAIDAHARSDPTIEMGGLLLGQVYQAGESYFVRVAAALPARHTDAGPGHLTFTAATWADILARRSAARLGVTVGWYHSHPGLGIFFSGLDLNVHQSHFADRPWYVALVVDPVAGEQGLFGWRDGVVTRLPDSARVPNL